MNKVIAKSLLKDLISLGVKEFFKKLRKSKPKHSPPEIEKKTDSGSRAQDANKSHPWRICPIGQHWVVTHPLTVPATEERPTYITTRDGHCADNPERQKGKSVKDYLTANEMTLIAQTYFDGLVGPPMAGMLSEFKNADQYDSLIRGWTRYWNEVFKPSEQLDADLVKALIGSESGFNLNPKVQTTKSAGQVHGLIQLTEQAIVALGDAKGELRNHYVKINTIDTKDPNLSIGAGIRWLFQKKYLASHNLKREASWEEAIAEYKSYLTDIRTGKNPNPTGMRVLRQLYGRLKNEKNK